MGLVEKIVAFTILAIGIALSGQLFGDSINTLGDSRLRDKINALINKDAEQIRQNVASWKANSNSSFGQLSYSPNASNCQNRTLASALLADTTSEVAAGTTQLDLSNIGSPLENTQVTRTIAVDSSNGNLISITYSTTSDSSVKTVLTTTLYIPAQSWCP